MKIELPKEDYEFLKELQHELNTLGKSDPIYYYELERLLKILKTMKFSD